MKTLKLSGDMRTIQLEKRPRTSIDCTFEGLHQFQNDGGEPHGSFEVFRVDPHPGNSIEAGWYWHACFPGCLPDSDCGPNGPFSTAEGAYLDAQGE